MFTPSSIFINMLVLLIASLYWFMSGHMIPAILGYLFIAIFVYNENFYFSSDMVAILALISVVAYFFIDYSNNETENGVMHFGIAVLYMIVIYLKARQIFNND